MTVAIEVPANTPFYGGISAVRFHKFDPPVRKFLAAICPEEEGGFSAIAVHFPGVFSQGDTEDEAKANIAEAFAGMLEACLKRGQDIERDDTAQIPQDCQKVWITIDG